MKLKCEQIMFEPLVYPRRLNEKGEPDWVKVYRYSRKMVAGQSFPPITVCKLKGQVKYLLVDGYHRLKAWRDLLKKREVDVQLIQCKNLDEIYIESLRRNSSHGIQLSPYEITNAILKLKDKGYSENSIGKILGMTPSDVKNMAELKIKDGSGGPMAVKAVLESIDVSDISSEQQRLFASGSQIKLLTEVIELIENGWLDTSNSKVIALVEKLRDLLKKL